MASTTMAARPGAGPGASRIRYGSGDPVSPLAAGWASAAAAGQAGGASMRPACGQASHRRRGSHAADAARNSCGGHRWQSGLMRGRWRPGRQRDAVHTATRGDAETRPGERPAGAIGRPAEQSGGHSRGKRSARVPRPCSRRDPAGTHDRCDGDERRQPSTLLQRFQL